MEPSNFNMPSLARLRPSQAVVGALGIGLVVFLLLDAVEQALAPGMVPPHLRLMHFIRGFLSSAGAMVMVWFVMARKETELLALRDKYAEAERHLFERKLLNQREDFLAVVNHRLRTPILANERTAALLLNGDFGLLTGQQTEILKHLLDNNRELDRLVRMLVDIYKYRNGDKHLEMVLHDPASSIDKIVARRAKKGIEIQTDVPEGVRVLCDVSAFEALVGHLVDNAVKYARSKVSLSANADEGYLRISIGDDGPGVAVDDVPTLFDRFFLSSSAGKYSANTGTGLCLCAEIAKAHGGSVECESVPGQGAVFIFRLPLAALQSRGSVIHI